MSLPQINEDDYSAKGIRVQTNPMQLPVAEAQRKFDELTLDVVVPKFNALATAQDAVNTDIEDRTTASETKTSSLETRATDVEDRATSLEARTTDIEDRTTASETKTSSLETRATDVEDRATSLETRTTGIEDRATTLETTIINKVDKVADKGLSTNDYTNEDKTLVETIPNKVDKVEGKGLSTNDYTDIDKSLVGAVSSKADASDVLTKSNTAEFTPTTDYQPATKKYVDINVIQGGVPQTRIVNGHPLSSDVVLTANDVNAPTATVPMIFSIYNGGLRVTYDDGE